MLDLSFLELQISRRDNVFFCVWDRTSLVAQAVKCLPITWETRVQSLDQEDLLEEEMATHSRHWRVEAGVAGVCLTLWETSQLSPKVTRPLYILDLFTISTVSYVFIYYVAISSLLLNFECFFFWPIFHFCFQYCLICCSAHLLNFLIQYIVLLSFWGSRVYSFQFSARVFHPVH